MRIDILTLFPAMLQGFFNESIIKRAQQKNIAEINVHNIRDYSLDKRHAADDYPYGGGAGMVMMPQPIADAIEKLKSERNYDEIIYLSPEGELLTQAMANTLSLSHNLMLLCGHYKGIDQRIRDHWITREISIGEYVISGGELPAAVLTDAVVRLLPGVLNDETSALSDSFQDEWLDFPQYTRPPNFRGYAVPGVLLSGNHAKIEEWREAQSEKKMEQRNASRQENNRRSAGI